MTDASFGIAQRQTFIAKLWALTKPYFKSEEKWPAFGLLGVIILMDLGLVYLSVQFNYWNNDFYNALQDKNIGVFWSQLGRFSWLAALYIIVAVYYFYLRQMLQIRWRRWMTHHFLDRWLADRSFYRLELTRRGTDNPEQRIEEDIALFTTRTLQLSLGLLDSIVTLISFFAILWTLSGPLSFHLGQWAISIPGYMVWVAVVYAFIGSWLTYKIGKPLVLINFEQQKFSADFRFSMSRIRENVESIALYGGEADENRRLKGVFARIWDNWWALMRRQKRLNWFTNGYDQLAVVFPILVSAPRYFAGEIQLGAIFQTASAFRQVQGALSWFIDAFTSLADWKASVDRLTDFYAAIELSKTETLASGHSITHASSGEAIIAAKDLGLALPGGQPLIENIALTIEPGARILLTGPSGSGKTTLFRALAGLWPFGKGIVQRPAEGRLLFLPQKPYLPHGSLRMAIAYPEPASSFSDMEIRQVLGDVGLGHLGARLEETGNWSLTLSMGEQQRLAFARALLIKPLWLFLDEATSALDEKMEALLYEMLDARLPEASIISIAHRGTVGRYHRRHLTVNPETKRLEAAAASAN